VATETASGTARVAPLSPSRAGAVIGGVLIALVGVWNLAHPGVFGEPPALAWLGSVGEQGDSTSWDGILLGAAMAVAAVWIVIGVLVCVAARRRLRLVAAIALAAWVLFRVTCAVESCVWLVKQGGWVWSFGVVANVVTPCLIAVALGLCVGMAGSTPASAALRICGVVLLAIVMVDQLFEMLRGGLVANPWLAIGDESLYGPAPWLPILEEWLPSLLLCAGWLVVMVSATSRGDAGSGTGDTPVVGQFAGDGAPSSFAA